MKLIRKTGATSNILQIFIADSSSTTGAGLTGLVFNTASLTAYYHKDTDTTATAITLVTMTVGTFTSSGFKEIDATNMPGWYQFCPPDAAFTSAKSVAFHLKGATNMAPLPIEVDLWAVDPQTATNFGLTALPTVAAGASNGLLISGSNAGTTTLAAMTVTGTLTVSDGISVARSTGNTSALILAGNGTGSGIAATGGATGHGALLTGGATSGDGVRATATTSGIGLNAIGIGTTQPGIKGTGGATTSAGMQLVGGATSGDGLLLSGPTLGHGLTSAGAGAGKNGINASGSLNGLALTGGGAGHGLSATGGGTGNGIHGAGGSTSGNGLNVTGGTLGHGISATGTGSSKHGILSTGGTAGTSDGASFVAGTGGVDLRAGITGSITGSLSGSVGSVTGAVGSVTGLTASNLDAAISSRMATYTQPTGFLAATFPTGTVANTTNITAGTITTATNLTNNNDKTGYALTSGERTSIADAMLDETAGIETGTTVRQGLKLFLAVLAGKVSGGGTTTQTIRDKADSKDRIVATVDASGNRTALTYDVT